MKTSFYVGKEKPHRIDIEWSPYSGLEVYKVDGQEVLTKRSWALAGTRRFRVGDGDEIYDIEIRVDLVPKLRSWFYPGDWIAQAYVNGKLYIDDLTRESRTKVRRLYWWLLILGFAVGFGIAQFIHWLLSR